MRLSLAIYLWFSYSHRSCLQEIQPIIRGRRGDRLDLRMGGPTTSNGSGRCTRSRTECRSTRLLWSRELRHDEGLEATPLASNGVIYTTGEWRHGLRARRKDRRNSVDNFDPKVPRARARFICCDVVNRGLALYHDKVFLAHSTAAHRTRYKNRQARLEVVTVDQSKSYSITGAPASPRAWFLSETPDRSSAFGLCFRL